MKSYFFVPASRLSKLSNVKKTAPNEIIIDFEDAIVNSSLEIYFKELNSIDNISSYWYRIPVRDDFDSSLNLDYIKRFENIGIKFVILPKLKSAFELIEIIKQFKKLKFIVLIEHPRLLLEIGDVLKNYPSCLNSITGIGLGSHDLMTFINAKHTIEQLDYPRKELLYLAKAYNLQAIDIASMNIFNQKLFEEEVAYAEDNGYDGKFIIHPKQLKWYKNQIEKEGVLIKWAENIIAHLPENYNGESIEPFILNEEVIEKPHAVRALEIIRNKSYGK